MEKMEKEKISYEGRLPCEVIEINTCFNKPVKIAFEGDKMFMDGEPIEITDEDREEALLRILDSIYEFARVDEKSLNPR